MLSDFATFVAGQWKVISEALPAFALAVLVCGAVIWLFARHHFSGQISVLRERISLRDDQLASMEKQLGADSPADALVRIGELTARIEALSIGTWEALSMQQIRAVREQVRVLKPGIVYIQMSDSARGLGYPLFDLFGELGWDVDGTRILGVDPGIVIEPDCDQARAMAEILRQAAGLEVAIEGAHVETDRFTITLGEKPYKGIKW